MTTFTTEDRILAEMPPAPSWEERWGKHWVEGIQKGWNKQNEIEYFWPLTEQIGLDLDYKGCEGPKLSVPYSPTGPTFTISNATWTTNIAPTLSVSPQNPVGQLNIGGVQIGLEQKPKWYQKVLYKLMGFNWKDK